MNRAQRRASAFKRTQRDRNAVEPSAVLAPITRHRQFSDEQAAAISNMYRMAWHKMTVGAGTTDDYYLLAEACNHVLIRAEGIDDLLVEVSLRAQSALVGMARRHIRVGRWGVDAAGLADIPAMLDAYYDIARLSTAQQLIDAANESRARYQHHGMKHD